MARIASSIGPPSSGEALAYYADKGGRPRKPSTLKPFIAWDGEGITPRKPEYPPFDFDAGVTDWAPGRLPSSNGKMGRTIRASKYTGRYSIANLEPPQDYVLFGCSAGRYVKAPSLSTEQCLDLLLEVEAENPEAIHVGFSLRYDVNMILRDLPPKKLWRIFRYGRCRWNGYYLEYRPGKWLAVNRKSKTGLSGATAKLFDVFGFFQCSFVKACEDLLGESDPELVGIRQGKSARKSFTFGQLDSFVLPYMEGELRMMVRLMDALRDSLLSAGLDLQSWHGAGAVASLILRMQKVRDSMAECPAEVQEAARYAYAGGRFELFKTGYYKGKVYEYDIRSAYPSAMRELPNLARGKWRRSDEYVPDSFSVWFVKYEYRGNREVRPPMPLFRRHKEGMVSYPSSVNGWYWRPECDLIPRDCIQYGYVFDPDDPLDKPYAFVEEMYETRRKWKAEGNSAQMAYKLGLNSLYGKMAQRVGGKDNKPPYYHQLEWAGYVTSATRAKIYRAVEMADDALIAIETDALFSSRPLDLQIGSALGEWEETTFDAICYIQNGFYYGWKGDKVVEKYRGFDKGSVPIERVLSHLRLVDSFRARGISIPSNCKLSGTTTRFIGFGLALHTRSVWRSWETEKYRGIDIGGNTKRAHKTSVCPECASAKPLLGYLHSLDIAMEGGDSYPHSLPWISGDEPERLPWEVAPDLARF